MNNLNRPLQQTYTEAEAAAWLGITVARLHELVDKHLFAGQGGRPAALEFTSTDLLLLKFWNNPEKTPSSARIIQMPKREK